MDDAATWPFIPLLVRHADVPERLAMSIRELETAEFGGSSFRAKYVPATPDWTLVLLTAAGAELCAFFHLVERQGFIDGRPARLGGLMNLVVTTPYRGQGLARRLLDLGTRIVLDVFDADAMITFPASPGLAALYQRYGFTTRRFHFAASQPSGPVTVDADAIVVTHPRLESAGGSAAIHTIDLNGNPW